MVLSALSPEILDPSKNRVVLSSVFRDSFSNRHLFYNAGFQELYSLFRPKLLLNIASLFCECWISTVFTCFFGRYSRSRMPESAPGIFEFPRAMYRKKGVQMWTCRACRGNAKDCTYLREGVPAWFLFPLLCMIAVYDIACQRQVLEWSGAPSCPLASERRIAADGSCVAHGK